MVVDELDRFLEENWHMFAVMGIFGTIGIYLSTFADTTGDLTEYSALTVGILSSLMLAIITGAVIFWKSNQKLQDSDRLTRIVFRIYNVLLVSVLIAIIAAILRLPGPVKGVISAVTILIIAPTTFYFVWMGLQELRGRTKRRILVEVVNIGILNILLLILVLFEANIPNVNFTSWVNASTYDPALIGRGLTRIVYLSVFMGLFVQVVVTIGILIWKVIQWNVNRVSRLENAIK
jgi:hypothetical protein